MKRILHVIHGLHRGGLENGVVNIANHLPQSEFTQAICCLEHVGEMAERLDQNVEVFEVNRGSYDYRAPLRLAAIIRKWRPDIIHCRNWNTWLDTVAAKLIGAPEVPLVWSFHGFAEGEQFPTRRKVASRILAHYTNRLFAVCFDSADRYASVSGIDLDRFNILYNGVDTNRFSPTQDKRTLRAHLNLPQDKLISTTVASLTPVKEHESLIRAASQVTSKFPGKVLFLCLGEGPLRGQMVDLIRKYNLEDSVSLPGNVDNVSEYLEASDFFVLPSRLEGMSNAALEAMSAGLPVIANDVGGNRELIEHGKTGFLCRHGEISSMAGAIMKLISDPQLRIQQANEARQKVINEFAMEVMIRRYAQFYRELLL